MAVKVAFPGKDEAGNYTPNPFAEQLDFFRRKLALPSRRWDDIRQSAHDRGFIVAGATKADLVADFKAAIERTIEEGRPIEWWRKNFDAIVAKHGWTGWTGEGSKGGRAWRTRVIYETNMATSYAAGRWAQLNDPELVAFRPYLKYHHADGVLNPRPQHVAWNGLVLPRDHPFWKTNAPPNGWGCHCYLSAAGSADYAGAQAAGKIAPPEGWDVRDAKGRLPGIDQGWDYAPGANAQTPLRELVDRKLIQLDGRIGAVMAAALNPVLAAERVSEFTAWADALGLPRGELMAVGALSENVVGQLAQRGREPATALISVRDEDVLHAHRDAKAERLPWAWYRELPRHVAAPRAVLFDKTDPAGALLMVFDIEGEAAKLVVKIDYEIEVRGADRIKRPKKANIIRTGKIVGIGDLRNPGSYDILEGEL